MTSAVDTLPEAATVDARRQFARGRHGAYPIVDDDRRCVGIVSRGDLLLAGRRCRPRTVLEFAPAGRRLGRPDDLAVTALQRLVRRTRRAHSGDRSRPRGRHLHSDRPPPRARAAVRARTPPSRMADHPVEVAERATGTTRPRRIPRPEERKRPLMRWFGHLSVPAFDPETAASCVARGALLVEMISPGSGCPDTSLTPNSSASGSSSTISRCCQRIDASSSVPATTGA